MIILILLDITAFIGRFHPLIVHLPIGFIIIAFLLEWRMKDDSTYHKEISYIWLASAVTSGISSLVGWLLANQGAYDNWTLFAHRWLGIVITIVCAFAWYVRKNPESTKYKQLTRILAIVMLAITGHLGGQMTHGSDYLLVHAPLPIQKLFGYGEQKNDLPQYSNPDNVNVYRDIINPTFDQKCMGCHNDKSQNGGLDMSSIESLSKGGDGGEVIIGGDANSELLQRVTLSTSSSKFMPTTGSAMSYQEIKLLEWWILEGANYDATVADLTTNPSVKATLLELYGLNLHDQ